MARHERPTLLYSQSAKIPVFSYRVVDESCTVQHYRWLVPNGATFAFYDAQIVTRGQGDDHVFQRVSFRGATVQAAGAYKELEGVLGNDVKEEPLLPEEQIQKQWSIESGYAKLQPVYERLLTDFCQTIAGHFDGARSAAAVNDTASLQKFFKGLSIGRSKSSYGFFMKAIKSGYEALQFYRSTYFLVRFHDFGLNDLVSYVTKHRKGFPSKLDYNIELLPGLKRVEPTLPPQSSTQKRSGPFPIPNLKTSKAIPKEYLDVITSTLKHWSSRSAMPFFQDPTGIRTKDVITQPKPVIVSEYAFRGDSRSPFVIFHVGGMHPNTIRHYADRKAMEKFEKDKKNLFDKASKSWKHRFPHFDPWLHQYKYDSISVFLSTSRDPRVSLGFVNTYGKGAGYIYLLRCPGAVDQQATFAETHFPHEAELSVPGGVDWDDVIAIRPVVAGIPASYCYVNTLNPWRRKEKAVQDAAIWWLVNFPWSANLLI